jgi:hypothetical protein
MTAELIWPGGQGGEEQGGALSRLLLSVLDTGFFAQNFGVNFLINF